MNPKRASDLGTYILLMLLMGSVPSSCTREDNPVVSSSPGVLEIQKFPMSIGDEWTYVVRDSLHNTTDSVNVRVSLPPAEFDRYSRLLLFSRRMGIDSVYLSIVGNTVLMYDSPGATEPSTTIVFPLSADAQWGSAVDTNRVQLEVDLTVPAGTLQTVFRVDRRVRGFNFLVNSQTWIAAGVGIVKMQRRLFQSAPGSYEEWELLRFRPG